MLPGRLVMVKMVIQLHLLVQPPQMVEEAEVPAPVQEVVQVERMDVRPVLEQMEL